LTVPVRLPAGWWDPVGAAALMVGAVIGFVAGAQ
jgi:hypothetical protein